MGWTKQGACADLLVRELVFQVSRLTALTSSKISLVVPQERIELSTSPLPKIQMSADGNGALIWVAIILRGKAWKRL